MQSRYTSWITETINLLFVLIPYYMPWSLFIPSMLERSKSRSFEVLPFLLSRKSFNTKWFLFWLNLPDDVPAASCSVWWYFLFPTALSVASQTLLYPIIFQHKENITSPLWFTYANNFIDKYINSLSFSTALAIFLHAQLGPVNLRGDVLPGQTSRVTT